MSRFKVALLIRSLGRGGAERQLVTLAKGLRPQGVDVVVLVFYGDGTFEDELVAAGVPVRCLQKTSRWSILRFVSRLVRTLRSERPDVLYGFCTTPNLLALAVKRVVPNMRVVWGVRSANLDLSGYDWLTRLSYRLEAALSSVPDLVIANSQAAVVSLLERGIPSVKVVHVSNGVDVDQYRYDATGRLRVRARWGIGDMDILIGMVTRSDRIKRHDTFVEAAALVAAQNDRARFVCIGLEGPIAEALRTRFTQLGLQTRFVLEKPADDLPPIYSALDVHVMCSQSEGSSNVVAEAMACGTPCVVTDVGDSRQIVGDSGISVEVGRPDELAQAILSMIDVLRAERESARQAARARIVERYSLEAMASNTLAALSRISGTGG
jgi:glycosyltransferase involved in cell wall biosynthesis